MDSLKRLDRDVRANPAYRLVPLDQLTARQREALEAAGVDATAVFGVLIGDPGLGLPDKVVDAHAAGLFAALEQPGRLPAEAEHRAAELVLDGVLEVRDAGGFVSGALACEAIGPPPRPPLPRDRLGRLSRAALAYAERLLLTDVERLTARLYNYNRVPLAPRWSRAYPDARAVERLLASPALARHWAGGLPAGDAAPSWLSWTRREGPLRARPDRLPYKLYVSPAVEALPDVLPVLVDVLTRAGARHFKVGPDAAGLLRPDKVVVYMADREELGRVGREVASALAGVKPHGVPFTAELAGDGLLSWGSDPPAGAGPVGRSVESWRLSVTRRLAECLAAAAHAPLRRLRPSEFALARLALDGIDVGSFAPTWLAAPERVA